MQAHTTRERRLVETFREQERIIWVARHPRRRRTSNRFGDVAVTTPGMALTRLSQLNLAALDRHIQADERVLVLSGVAGSQHLDTLVIVKPTRD